MNCKICKYWKSSNNKVGVCTKYAPKPATINDKYGNLNVEDYFAIWPQTLDTESCGEGVIR